ncbi:unnamed protein product [Acanthoscelides obtectus]|uniref:Uncharacterized protein n=1 Tax=Acanthoscelides obtectus TaxID=200917 RepID=A0A9P0JY26_ACAOB|nr:unnamed protein product [Acanthoscelides obtectus]CAK1646087.1 hypothetical protein AOBTE_LOCUS14447 [Acanthoscelides obtectus]
MKVDGRDVPHDPLVQPAYLPLLLTPPSTCLPLLLQAQHRLLPFEWLLRAQCCRCSSGC